MKLKAHRVRENLMEAKRRTTKNGFMQPSMIGLIQSLSIRYNNESCILTNMKVIKYVIYFETE
jgi:hypothetical protein